MTSNSFVSFVGVNFKYALFVLGIGAAPLFGQDPLPESPVRLYGYMERMDPQTNYSDADVQFIAEHFDVVVGLDGHSYNFPGVIDQFREFNPDTPVLCSWDTMSIQATSTRFGEVDLEEGLFLHSADPASLRVLQYEGKTIGWFRRDARAILLHEFYPPPGVQEYIVERADSPDGPFVSLEAIPEDGSLVYRFEDADLDATRYYRVRTRLADGLVVDYSWSTQADVGSAASVAVGVMVSSGGIAALCYGPECPASPDGLILETDINNNRIFGEGDCSAQGADLASCERWPFEQAQPYTDGATLYTGSIIIPGDWNISYRTVLQSDPQVRCPLQGGHQRTGYNNRIQTMFDSYLVWPDHPLWHEMLQQRLGECLAAGYDGMRLDFAHDTLDRQWIGSGLPFDWQGPDDPRIADGVVALLAGASAFAPDAILTFNGFFSVQDRQNYYRYLAEASGAEFEFLGFGWDDQSTTLDPSTAEALHGMWATAYDEGKWAVAIAGHLDTNTVARLESLALYLLILRDGMYYFFSTDAPATDIPYFPEWDVPLGAPVADLTHISDIVDPRGDLLLSREYESGWVFFNDDSSPVTIELDDTYYLLSVTGGRSPSVGGDGAANYSQVQSLTIGPNDAAIIVRQSPDEPSGSDPICGNGLCEEGEWCTTCPADCSCDDGIACTLDFCNEDTGSCEQVFDDAACDDGLFCNGTETCSVDGCLGGGEPCPGELCDEQLEICAECLSDSDCGDADACTADVCAAGVCVFEPLESCCGDGFCEAGEDCSSCPSDCEGRQKGAKRARFCCGNGILEQAEGDGSVCDGNP